MYGRRFFELQKHGRMQKRRREEQVREENEKVAAQGSEKEEPS